MNKKIAYIFLYVILVTALLTAFVPAAMPTLTNAATKVPPTPKPTLIPTPTQIPGVGPGGKIPLGIVLPDNYSPIFAISLNSFRSYLQKLGYSATILYSQGNVEKELANVQSLIDKEIKVLIITPVDATGSKFAADMANLKGIKVISYDRLIQNSSAVSYYVSFDNIAVGQAQAQYLVDNVKGAGVPLYLYAGSSEDNNAFMFFEGAWNILQPKIADGTFVIKNSNQAASLQDSKKLSRSDLESILGEISIGGWNPDEAKKMAKADLQETSANGKGDVAVLAPNDGTARAISDVFKADKDVKSFVITGQDADSASLQYIRSGRQTMTVFKDTRVLAKDAIDVALAFLADQTPASTTTINNGLMDIPFNPSAVVIIDKSNVDTFKK